VSLSPLLASAYRPSATRNTQHYNMLAQMKMDMYETQLCHCHGKTKASHRLAC